MTTMYKVKGIGKETTITSKVNIFHEGGKITRVEDKWDGKLPDSGIANVSNYRGYILNPFFWTDCTFSWCFAFWVLMSDTWPAMVRGLCGFYFDLIHCILLSADIPITLPAFICTDDVCYRHSDDSMLSASPRWSACPRTLRRMPSAATRSAATW